MDSTESYQEQRMLRWRQLCESGVFDDSYPQRVNASFEYLDKADCGSVVLKDFIDRGPYVCSFLSLEIVELSFAVLDAFRYFDIKADGFIKREEFVVGVIKKLLSMADDEALLITVSMELLEASLGGNFCNLVLMLKHSRRNESLSDLTKYKSNFFALTYLLHDRVKSLWQEKIENTPSIEDYNARSSSKGHGEEEEKASTSNSSLMIAPPLGNKNDMKISLEELKGALKYCLEKAIVEVQCHFQMSSKRFCSIIKEADHIVPVIPPHLDDTLTSMVQFGIVESTSVPYYDPQTEDTFKLGVGNDVVVEDGVERPLGSNELRDAKGIDNQSQQQISQRKQKGSQVGNSMEQLHAGDRDSASQSSKLDPSLDGLRMALTYLNAQGLSIDPENDIDRLDACQLFLLQTALRSLNSFFQLVKPVEQSILLPKDALFSSSSRKYEESTTSNASFEAKATEKQIQRRDGNGNVGNDEHTFPSLPKVDTGMISAGSNVETTTLNTVLVQVQESLRRAQMRNEVLEMVQVVSVVDDVYDGPTSSPQLSASETFGDVQTNALPLSNTDETSSNLTKSKEDENSPQDEEVTYDRLMDEIANLKACYSQQADKDHALGVLINEPTIFLTAEGKTAAPAVVGDLQEAAKKLRKTINRRGKEEERIRKLSTQIRAQAEELSELRLTKEQCQQERNEHIALVVELQILREKVQRQQNGIDEGKKAHARNVQLKHAVKELEEQLKEATTFANHGAKGSIESKSSDPASVEMTTKMAIVEERFNVVCIERDRLKRELARVSNLLKLSEQRLKASLQDHVTLNQQFNATQDELSASKTFIAQLMKDIEHERSTKTRHGEFARQIQEHQFELNKKEQEVKAAKESGGNSGTLKQELIAAEKLIEVLENKLSEASLEMEKGVIAMEQLDEYREQLRQKVRENRELSLQNHSLESQLRDVNSTQQRNADMQDELLVLKLKVDKIPGLLAEIARLRGASRATVKSLTEQDTFLAQFKKRIQQLERENSRLKADSRSLKDMDAKLAEANAEISKLMIMVNKAGMSHSHAADSNSGSTNATTDKPAQQKAFKNHITEILNMKAEAAKRSEEHAVNDEATKTPAVSATSSSSSSSSSSASSSSSTLEGDSQTAPSARVVSGKLATEGSKVLANRLRQQDT